MVAGRWGGAQGTVGMRAAPWPRARIDAGLRGPPCALRAARVRRCATNRPITDRLGDERDEPHRAMAGRARERVDLGNLLQEGRQSAGGLGRRESWGGDDQEWRIGCCGLGLSPHAARTIAERSVKRGASGRATASRLSAAWRVSLGRNSDTWGENEGCDPSRS